MTAFLQQLSQSVLPMLLCFVLLFAVDLNLDQESEGGVPFFNDEGTLTLPRESEQELEESMPELKLFRSPAAPAPASASLDPQDPLL